jgi:hypothetical protein
MKPIYRIVVLTAVAIGLLSAVALAVKPKPGAFLGDNTKHYEVTLFVSDDGKKIQGGIQTGYPANCGTLHARSDYVKIRHGAFKVHKADGYADWTIKGHFVSKTKAKGTVVATINGSKCPKDDFVAKAP